MKFSISLGMVPPREALPLARAADAAGYHAIAVPESVFYPQAAGAAYPYTRDGVRFWGPETPFVDPFVAIPAMAAVTERLFFYSNVIKLGIRHPLLVAKSVGSVAALVGPRVGLGVGIGWIPEEFAWCGTSWEQRGARVDEAIEVIAACLRPAPDATPPWVEHHGRFYDFGPLTMVPTPEAPVPLYVGGHSEPALRRAARLGDGWTSAMLKLRQVAPLVARLAELRREYGRERLPFEVQVACVDVFDLDGFRRLRDAGCTDFITQPWVFQGHGLRATLAERVDGLQRFAEATLGKL